MRRGCTEDGVWGREDGERLSENSHETVDNRVAIYIAQENTAFD